MQLTLSNLQFRTKPNLLPDFNDATDTLIITESLHVQYQYLRQRVDEHLLTSLNGHARTTGKCDLYGLWV